MRPSVRFLSDELAERITAEARETLAAVGMEIECDDAATVLREHGAGQDEATGRLRFTEDMIDAALAAAPSSFRLYGTQGRPATHFAGDHVHFTPGSTAINVLDGEDGSVRPAMTADYIACAKLVGRLGRLASQSTAIVPSDVPEAVSDSWRLYLSLMLGEKPVVTGAFSVEAFEVMRDLQLAVRGSAEALRAKPLTVFSCCATAPLRWTDLAARNLMDCARHGIPAEIISMPLAGFTSPVTLVGSLVQAAAEVLSGVVISQLAAPGAPVLWGTSAAVFDVRCETTPMGAVESMMLACAHNEIGKRLGLPTQAYIGLSDAKDLDAQAGLEASMGATLAVLAGINSISGPGMIDFENCFGLEALVLDHEICGMALRLIQGVEPKEDFPALPNFEELLREQHLLIADHTRKHLRREHHFPSDVICRASRPRWEAEGKVTLRQRAHAEVRRLLAEYEPPNLADEVKKQLTERMAHEARRHGMDTLPSVDA